MSQIDHETPLLFLWPSKTCCIQCINDTSEQTQNEACEFSVGFATLQFRLLHHFLWSFLSSSISAASTSHVSLICKRKRMKCKRRPSWWLQGYASNAFGKAIYSIGALCPLKFRCFGVETDLMFTSGHEIVKYMPRLAELLDYMQDMTPVLLISCICATLS